MDFCARCGHADYVHTNFVGVCIHGQMKPKDGLDCDCPGIAFGTETLIEEVRPEVPTP